MIGLSVHVNSCEKAFRRKRIATQWMLLGRRETDDAVEGFVTVFSGSSINC